MSITKAARVQRMAQQHCVANRVEVINQGFIQSKCTLVLQQIPETNQLRHVKEISSSGSTCDIAVFVYDAHSEASFQVLIDSSVVLTNKYSKMI